LEGKKGVLHKFPPVKTLPVKLPEDKKKHGRRPWDSARNAKKGPPEGKDQNASRPYSTECATGNKVVRERRRGSERGELGSTIAGPRGKEGTGTRERKR